MNEYFNKSLFFENIGFILKKKNKRIGELEAEAGVSLGYISRTSKEGNAKPGIDFIINVAESLQISIDTLLKVDLTSLTATEEYLVSFLEKLINDTVTDKLDWQCESMGYLNNRITVDGNGICLHPLFSLETIFEPGDGVYPDEITKPIFKSKSYDASTLVDGDCFNLKLKNGARLYIMNVCEKSHKGTNLEPSVLEMWISPQDGENQFLCSDDDATGLAPLVDSLYMSITESMKHPKVKKEIKDIIDAFMLDDFGNE